MNKAFLIGRLTKDPETRTTGSGATVTSFRLAVNRRVNREETDYFDIVTWRALADTCAKYLAKGRQVAVCGEIHNRSYDGKDGKKRTVTEIVADEVEFIGAAKERAEEDGAAAAQAADLGRQIEMHTVDDLDDLPF